MSDARLDFTALPGTPRASNKPSNGPTTSQTMVDQPARESKNSATSNTRYTSTGSSWDCWFCCSTPGPMQNSEVVVVSNGQSTYCCVCPDNCCSNPSDSHHSELASHGAGAVHASHGCCNSISCCLDRNCCDCNCDCDCSGCDLSGC
jgi:hypothetical protein